MCQALFEVLVIEEEGEQSSPAHRPSLVVGEGNSKHMRKYGTVLGMCVAIQCDEKGVVLIGSVRGGSSSNNITLHTGAGTRWGKCGRRL